MTRYHPTVLTFGFALFGIVGGAGVWWAGPHFPRFPWDGVAMIALGFGSMAYGSWIARDWPRISRFALWVCIMSVAIFLFGRALDWHSARRDPQYLARYYMRFYEQPVVQVSAVTCVAPLLGSIV